VFQIFNSRPQDSTNLDILFQFFPPYDFLKVKDITVKGTFFTASGFVDAAGRQRVLRDKDLDAVECPLLCSPYFCRDPQKSPSSLILDS